VADHARERMVERHGRDLTDERWCAAVTAIAERRAMRLRANTDGGGEFWLWEPVAGLRFLLVWKAELRMVVTVLADEHALPAPVQKAKTGRVRELVTHSPGRWLRGAYRASVIRRERDD
jgi:hypothetical protein